MVEYLQKKIGYNLFEKTNADGIMIARGAIGNPWLSKEILINEDIKLSEKQKIDILIEHYEYMIKTKGEERASKEIRKYFCYYTKGFQNSNILRGRIAEIVDKKSFLNLVNEFKY